MKKFTKERLTEAATDQAGMDIDAEEPADQQQLQELVRKQAQSETKTLHKKIQQLESQLSTLQVKNSERGRGGASKQKQKGRRTSAKQQSSSNSKQQSQKKRRDQKADSADSDSSGGSNSKKKGTGRKKNRRKKRRSKTGNASS